MIDLDAARRGDENVSTPADLARLVAGVPSRRGAVGLVESHRARDPAEAQADADPNRRAGRTSPSPARAASWKASAPTPASSTFPAGRTCLSRWGRSCERTRNPRARSSTLPRSATSTSAAGRPSARTAGRSNRALGSGFGHLASGPPSPKPKPKAKRKGRSSVYPMPARYESIGRARIVNACMENPEYGGASACLSYASR